MNNIIQTIIPSLEILYYICTIGILITAIYAAQQVSILRRDMLLRNQRAAREKAIEYSTRYGSVFIPMLHKYQTILAESGLELYNGEVSDFTLSSIPDTVIDDMCKRYRCAGWQIALNELEGIAAAFVSGVADEQVGFLIFGPSYCYSICQLYDILCFRLTKIDGARWHNTRELYTTWSHRIAKMNLQVEENKIKEQLDRIHDRTIPYIGCE